MKQRNGTTSEAAKDPDAFINDIRDLVSESEELVSAVAKEGGKQFAEVSERIASTLGRAKSKLVHWEADMKDSVKKAADNTNEYVTENPWHAVGIGAAVGMFLGFLVGRR